MFFNFKGTLLGVYLPVHILEVDGRGTFFMKKKFRSIIFYLNPTLANLEIKMEST